LRVTQTLSARSIVKRFHLVGVVRPERAGISISKMGIRADIGGVPFTFTFQIACNQLLAIVDTDESNTWTIRNELKHFVDTALSLVGFLKGYSYDVDITALFDGEMKAWRVYGNDIPVLAKRGAAIDLNVAANKLLPLCRGQNGPFLRRCFTDLSLAMRSAHDTGFYCFRAIESLKQSFPSSLPAGNERDAEQWKAMAAAINASKEEMDLVRDFALPARHGVGKPVTDEERKQMFLKTWDIVERYVNYRLAEAGETFRLEGG
jgi:hypothetical protein